MLEDGGIRMFMGVQALTLAALRQFLKHEGVRSLVFVVKP